MQQSEAQKIGLRAGDIFNYLRPKNWIIRSQQEIDLGIDYEIEILSDNGQTTGAIAKVQLKGSENLSYINNEQTISFQFELDNARYLIEEITIPSYLVVCDNIKEKCYWVSFKNCIFLKQAYQKALNSNKKTFAIHINIQNDMSKTSKEFIKDILLSNKVIATQTISNIHIKDFENLNINRDKYIESLENQIEVAEYSKMQELFSKHKNNELLSFIDKVLKSNKSIVFKFNSLAYKRDTLKKLIPDNYHNFDKYELRSNINKKIALEYIELTKHLDDKNILKVISYLWLDISLLDDLSKKFQWLHISIQQHEKEPEDFSDFWLLTISSQIKELYSFIAKLLVNIFDKIYIVANSEDNSVVIDIIPEFILSLTGFLLFFERDDKEGFKILENNLDMLVNSIIKYVINNNYTDKLIMLILIKLQYKSICIGSNIKEYGYNLKNEIYPFVFSIQEKDIRNNILQAIKEYSKSIISSREESNNTISINDEISILKEQMRGFGVNVDNPESEHDKAIVEAINAINPERVLRICKNRYIYLKTSPLGQMIKLYTLGVKGLYCLKHKYRCETVFLDSLSDFMNMEYCSKCKDKIEHKKDWQWTREWQQEQNKLYVEKINTATTT